MRVIRRLTPADAAELTALRVANRAYLSRWEPDADDPDRWYRAESVEAWITDGHERFAVLENGAIAGMVSLTGIEHGAFRSAMISYFVDEARTGRGLGARAVAALVERGFRELGLHRIEAGTAVANVASHRVLEKNRFRRVGVLRSHLLLGGVWTDHYLWELIRGD
jgi:[ribosomal protein S5]-alanine N-acetyltransferase